MPGGAGYRRSCRPALDRAGFRCQRGALLRVWEGRDTFPVEWWAGPVQVVHGTNFVVPPARRAARVVTVWDLTCVRFPELCTPAALRYPALVARAVAGGATVHVLAQSVADEVAEHFGVSGERLVVIPPGVSAGPPSTPPLAPPPAAPLAALGSGGAAPAARGAPYVLALGTVEPRKDLPALVRAFDLVAAVHADLELQIAGPAGWGEEDLQQAIAAAQHRPRIHRLGWVEPHDRDRLLAGAAVFAYPSRYEGFGFPPLEAMAAGVPVVATAAGAIPEVVGDAAILVPVSDVEALAGGLERALVDDDERRRLLAAGLRRVAHYDWARAGTALSQLYQRLAS